MDIQDARRAALRAYIAKEFPRPGDTKGNVSAFSQRIKKAQSQIADTLDGRKSFGEKVANNLQELVIRAGLPPIDWGTAAPAAAPPKADKRSLPLMTASPEALDFAREWDKLAGPAKLHIQALVECLVAEQVRAERKKSPPAKNVGTRPHA